MKIIKYAFAIGLLCVASARADEAMPTSFDSSETDPVKITVDCFDLVAEKLSAYRTLLGVYKPGDDQTSIADSFAALLSAFRACHDEKLAAVSQSDDTVFLDANTDIPAALSETDATQVAIPVESVA